MTKSPWWPRIRRIWATVGTIAFVVFVSWSLLAYRESGTAKMALVSDDSVVVSRADGARTFMPAEGRPRSTTRLLFVAGSLVDPAAYAPLARSAVIHEERSSRRNSRTSAHRESRRSSSSARRIRATSRSPR